MYSYRVTKYNAKNRNKDDTYTLKEWTSISDFKSEELNSDYISYEYAYINAIYEFMNLNCIQELFEDTIIYVEEFESPYIKF